RRDDGKAPGRWNPQTVHRLADDELSQHRTERRPPVAAPRVGRRTGALQLNVEPIAAGRQLFTEQNRAAVPEGREMSELMTRVGLRDRAGSVRQAISGENRGTLVAGEHGWVESEVERQPVVEHHYVGRADRGWHRRSVKE